MNASESDFEYSDHLTFLFRVPGEERVEHISRWFLILYTELDPLDKIHLHSFQESDGRSTSNHFEQDHTIGVDIPLLRRFQCFQRFWRLVA
ncbi:hypothetical protein ACQJBY_002414 [Aegilops geniculata]